MGEVYARHVLRFIFIVALLGTWFMPLIIAALYKLPHQGPIAVLSLALGWTGVGWLAALIIAVGGAIRASRPVLAGQAQPEAMPQAGGYPAAMPAAPAQPGWPAAATTLPGQTPSPEAAPSPERAPFPGRAAPPRSAPSPQRSPGPPPPSWPGNPR